MGFKDKIVWSYQLVHTNNAIRAARQLLSNQKLRHFCLRAVVKWRSSYPAYSKFNYFKTFKSLHETCHIEQKLSQATNRVLIVQQSIDTQSCNNMPFLINAPCNLLTLHTPALSCIYACFNNKDKLVFLAISR